MHGAERRVYGDGVDCGRKAAIELAEPNVRNVANKSANRLIAMCAVYKVRHAEAILAKWCGQGAQGHAQWGRKAPRVAMFSVELMCLSAEQTICALQLDARNQCGDVFSDYSTRCPQKSRRRNHRFSAIVHIERAKNR